MNKWLILSLLGSSILAPLSVSADDFKAVAPIKDVTVYRGGGAKVTRTGTLNLPVGQHTITINGLHEGILNAHIAPQAAIESKEARLTDLKFSTQTTVQAASELQSTIKSKIAAIDSEIDTVKNQITANSMKLSFIKSIAQGQATSSNFKDIEALSSALNFVGTSASSILSETQAHQQTLKTLKTKRNALLRELKRSGKPRIDYQQAVLHINNERTQQVDFSITYFVQSAGWKMAVKADLDTEQAQLDINLKARITQNTGENWQNIRLSLSNSMPSGYIGDTDINSQFVGFTRQLTQLRKSSMERLAAPAMFMAKDESDYAGAPVSINDGRFDRTLTVTNSATILSTGEANQVDIKSSQVPTTIVSRAVPYKNPTAYVFADTRMADDFLTVREVDVTLSRDGNYAGTGTWPDLELGRTLQLPFGEDSGIEITYQELAPEDGDKGFINKRKIEQKRYLISVTNNHTEPAPVEIYDRYPVSAHEDIKVKPLKGATKPTESNIKNRPGVIKWRKTLAPGETWAITHAYEITYPADKNIRKSER